MIKSITKIDYTGDTYNLHIKDNHNYFAEGLCVSNCHTAKADVLYSILKNNNFERKLGVTGSMPIIELDAMILESNFGKPKRYINAKQLMELGLATELTIVAMFLNYPKVPFKLINTYHKEIKYQKESILRKEWVNRFLKKLTGVTVALYNHTDLGEDTWTRLTNLELNTKTLNNIKLQKELKVFIISGKTKPKIREEIRLHLNTVEDAVVIAQYSIMSTGINIPKLKNLVYLQSNKSYTATLQSIGRVLRLHDSKPKAFVFDLVDVMSGTRKDDNYLLRHFWERSNYYHQEDFNIIEKEIYLKKF